jgi:signal transduction histidine kinase
VVAANAAAEALFGHEPGALAGTRLDALMDDAPAGLPRQGRRRDGTPLRLDVRESGLRDDDGRRLILAVREVQEDRPLVLRERLDLLDQQSRLMSRVSHDLANLFAVVRNYGEFVAEEVPTPSQTRDDLNEILQAAQRGVALSRELAGLAHTTPAEPAPLALNALVETLLPALEEAAGDGVRLRAELDPALPDVVLDRDHAGRILEALVRDGAAELDGPGLVVLCTRCPLPGRVELAVTPQKPPEADDIPPRRVTVEPHARLPIAVAHALATRAGGAVEVDGPVRPAMPVRLVLPAAAAE